MMPSHVINKEVNERAAVIESQTGKNPKEQSEMPSKISLSLSCVKSLC